MDNLFFPLDFASLQDCISAPVNVRASLQAVSALSAPLKALNDLLHTKAGRKSPTWLADVAATVAGLEAVMGGLLGLATRNPTALLQVWVMVMRSRELEQQAGRCDAY